MSNWDVLVTPHAELQSGPAKFSSKREIDTWLDNLPAAATGEVTRQLYQTLQELARQRIAPELRFHFLERSGALFHGILRNLERHVYRGGFPLDEVNTKTARLILLMLALKVINYRMLLDDLHESLLAGGLKRNTIRRQATLRVMEMLGEMFELYRHLDVHPSTGLWQLYNRFFAVAEAEKLLRRPLMTMDGQTQTTIASEFILQQLLVPLNPHDFRHSEYLCAKAAIRQMAADLPIATQGQVKAPGSFCLRLDEDGPLSFYEPERAVLHESSPQRRCLEITALKQRLRQFLKGEQETLEVGGCPLSRHAARMMLSGWEIQQEKRPQRTECLRTVRLAHGLSTIARVIARSTQAPSTELLDEEDGHEVVVMGQNRGQPFDHLDVEVEGFDLQQHLEQLQKEGDLWNSSYTNLILPAENWIETAAKPGEVLTLDGQLIDQSPGGYGIALAGTYRDNQFQIGDLMALELDDHWQLLSIRWIRRDDGELRLGLHRLGDKLRSQALVVSRRGKPSQPMPMLHIEHYSGVPAVVLHNINIHTQDQIIFLEGQAQVSIQLGELLDTSAAFECYQLDRTTMH